MRGRLFGTKTSFSWVVSTPNDANNIEETIKHNRGTRERGHAKRRGLLST